MRERFIPLSVPNLKGNELEYVTQAIKDEWVSTGGEYIAKFEEQLAEYMGCKGAVACQSGTAGIHLSLIAMEIGHNDEVIAPSLTFIAAVNPIKYVGAVPIFMDCDSSLCMDLNKVKKFCEEECEFISGKLINKVTRRHVKAMIVVHVFGNMADMELALYLKEKYKLYIIEDATEALGTYVTKGKLKGKHLGTIGDLGVVSFNGNKIITTGGGGMVTSNNLQLLDEIKYLSTQAKDDPLYYIHNKVGYNYRMTNVQAAIGVAQLEQIEEFVNIKNKNYEIYKDEGTELLPFKNNIRSNKWFYSFTSNKRDELITFLNKKGIQSRPIWNLIPFLKPYENEHTYGIDCAQKYWESIVNIPCSTNLTYDDIKYVADSIKEFEE